jgi:hypothetical protein
MVIEPVMPSPAVSHAGSLPSAVARPTMTRSVIMPASFRPSGLSKTGMTPQSRSTIIRATRRMSGSWSAKSKLP